MTSKHTFHKFIPVWVKAPVLRILPALMSGIITGWYLQVSFIVSASLSVLGIIGCVISYIIFTLKKQLLFGIFNTLLFFAFGCMLVWLHGTKNRPSFISKNYKDTSLLIATLQEPLNEKNKSYKAEASVEIWENNELRKLDGNIIIYLQKDNSGKVPAVSYGSQILLRKPLQPITNAGNPGGFDYQRYAGFHGIYFQVFLKPHEYKIGTEKKIVSFRQMLFDIQKWVLFSFRKYIPGRAESGVAEALLIGYRNDLDIDLVQRYSNTGVVHIIAISGMHLGLIYGLLVFLFKPLGQSRKVVIIRSIIILVLLWVFTLLTGAAPSIVRSAIMFTFVVLGEMQKRKASIYNNLALSALLILVADPFSLWDVGFQLSYLAVLSIAVFATPISKWFYFKYKIFRWCWQFIAITLAAQILTYPVVAFHFHQFPNLFLLTNIVAVPLSSCILYALIFLLVISEIPLLATLVGELCSILIGWMNAFIGFVDQFAFALTDGIYFTIPQAAVLFMVITACSWWLTHRSSKAFVAGLYFLGVFYMLRTWQFVQEQQQQKLIVYNVPQHSGIDLIQGNRYQFFGDSLLNTDGFLRNFHLKPSRVMHQVEKADTLPNITTGKNIILAGNKKVLLIHRGVDTANNEKIKADLVIISANPNLKLTELLQTVQTDVIVADATNSRYKIARWQKEATALHLRLHSVATDGAYTLNW